MSNKKIILTIFGLLFVGMALSGATYAFFTATISNNSSISSNTYEFDATLDVSVVKNGKLVPVEDDLIDDSVNNSDDMCEGTDGYYLCNVYQITLTNNGNISYVFSGNVKTLSGTTYTTSNMKYQLYTLENSTYTSLSDSKNLSSTVDSISEFTLNDNAISFSLNVNQSKTYYLVLWLSDTNSNQLEDVNKKYLGSIEFALNTGETLSADFTS